jgi:hypothetical protein
MPNRSAPRKSLTLNVTIGEPVRTATQNTIIVGVRQNRSPAEVDLNEASAAAEVLDEVVDVVLAQF